ncbi:uncharacterized protein EAE98_004952 [Botrytis deweyae]|uniref:Uncharacterized protein n=1 Tax=Botrytis deweyae TaxID=2478750 RepID=A0ABQ7IPT9_9HELO|nr:uncharacterized protein EAE98_004952 [Botrytis deweyae]KAF7930552.1 hypothetical protein EAE98_004952 [Botrytis deweyae]
MSAAKEAKILKLNDEEKSKADLPRGNKLTPKLQDSISAIDPNVQTNVSAAPPAGHQLLQYHSEEQVALVLSILKSKPDGISIQDNLNELRESIKLEESRSNRIVDSGEFWKRQCESQCILTDKLQTRIASQSILIDELQTRIASLEKKLQRCRVPSMTSSSEDSEEEEIPSIAQRSTESHKDQPLKPARKKKRKRYESLDTVPDEDDEMGTDALALAYNHDHMMVATYLYRINQMRQSLHAESASASCRKLIELSWKAISDCVPKYIDVSVTNYHTKDIKCLAHLMSEIVECYKSCVEVSTEHYKTIAGRELVRKSNIIHSLCSFFDKALSELDKLCITKTKLPIRSEDSTSDWVETSADNDESMMVRFVANLLFGILGKIAWQQNNDLHKQIFEGILAFIIDHTGMLISKIIFREHIAASKLPGNIATGDPSLDLTKKECALKSKYLIHLLEMALKIHEENIGTGPTEELLQKAKRKIQNTLKNSIIGGSLLGLKKPVQSAEEPIDIPGLEGLEVYSEDWAIQCVFTMIEIDENEDDEGVRVGGSGEAVTY